MVSAGAHPILAELKALVGPDGLLADPNELRVYECDGFTIAKGMPLAVVFPRTPEQAAACVKAIAKHGLELVPRGSGTGLAGGGVAYEQGVILSTSRMTEIESINLADRVAVVQAGVRNLALTDALQGTGLRFSPDPSSQRASTIGGNASTNAGGINTLKHGVTTNHILGAELVLTDGSVVRTRANGCCDGIGADLPGLLCGSEGTLGIITRLWCKLVPDPRHFRTVYAVFQRTQDACKTVADVVAAGILPTSMEMMDGAMIKVVEAAFHFGFDTTAGALLLIEVDGVEQTLDAEMESIADIARRNGATDIQKCSDPARRLELWSARKKAFGAIGRISHSYCTQDACVPRSVLPQVIAEVGRIGEKYQLKITNVFHAGDGNIHPILLFDEADPQQVQRVMRASEEILRLCLSVGGTITGEHGVGVEKLHLMKEMFNPATLDLFLQVKKTFDPRQHCNDAKLIPSDRLVIELLKPTGANVPGGAL